MDCMNYLAVFQAALELFFIFISFALAVLLDANIYKIDPVAGSIWEFVSFFASNLKYSEIKEKYKNYLVFSINIAFELRQRAN